MMKTIFYAGVAIFCFSWTGKNIIAPGYAYLLYSDKYIYLAGQCANAMDETWFIEQKGNDTLNKTAQIHLLSCHEYDVTRKIMLSLGLNEDVLSYLGLRALEVHQRSTEEFVQQHRFNER
uniref:TIGR03982 family His-Xaa-Ser system protein n=1 Tax=Marinomonas sp. (strain MWYL1) TaxID=400668 RepID=A6VXJ1_MARMS